MLIWLFASPKCISRDGLALRYQVPACFQARLRVRWCSLPLRMSRLRRTMAPRLLQSLRRSQI